MKPGLVARAQLRARACASRPPPGGRARGRRCGECASSWSLCAVWKRDERADASSGRRRSERSRRYAKTRSIQFSRSRGSWRRPSSSTGSAGAARQQRRRRTGRGRRASRQPLRVAHRHALHAAARRVLLQHVAAELERARARARGARRSAASPRVSRRRVRVATRREPPSPRARGGSARAARPCRSPARGTRAPTRRTARAARRGTRRACDRRRSARRCRADTTRHRCGSVRRRAARAVQKSSRLRPRLPRCAPSSALHPPALQRFEAPQRAHASLRVIDDRRRVGGAAETAPPTVAGRIARRRRAAPARSAARSAPSGSKRSPCATGMEDPEVRLRVGAGRRRPLPAAVVAGGIAVDEALVEEALAAAPVDAAGPWSRKLATTMRARLCIQPVRRELAHARRRRTDSRCGPRTRRESRRRRRPSAARRTRAGTTAREHVRMLGEDRVVELAPDQLVDPLARRRRARRGSACGPRARRARRCGRRSRRSAGTARGARCRRRRGDRDRVA